MKKANILLTALLISLFAVSTYMAVNAAPSNFRMSEVETSNDSTITSNNEQDDEVESTGEYVKKRNREMENSTDTEKEKKRAEIAERVQEKSMHAMQNAIKRYERVKTQVQNSNLSETEKADIVAKLDTQISSMNALKIQIENAKTYDEVKNIMTQLKTRFKYSLGVVRQSIKGVFEDRLENILEKITTVYTRTSEKVDALPKSETKDDLSASLSQIQDLLVSAKTNIENNNPTQTKKDLTDARELLVNVVKSLKNLEE